MKLLYINPQSYSNLAQYDYNLLSNVESDEIIYCCNILYDMPVLNKVRYKNVFSYSNLSNNILKALSYTISILQVLWTVFKERPDVIHIQWWRLWQLDYLALAMFKKLCPKIVYTAHNVVPHNTGDTMKSKCIKYYNRVDEIIVHAQNTKKELVEDFGIESDKISVIPHGIIEADCDEQKVQQIMKDLNEEFGLHGKVIFSVLGLQSEYKGTQNVKDALLKNKVAEECPNAFFFIVGRGSILTPEDCAGLKNVYVVNKFVEAEFMQAVLRTTNVLLLPYQRISQSGVLLSAFSWHIPYAATNVGGLTEALDYADVGWNLEDSSAKTISELIIRLSNSPEEVAQKTTPENWEKIASLYDWVSIGKSTTELYSNKGRKKRT